MHYLLPSGETYGEANVMLRPELQRADLSCAKSGSLKDWQDRIARYAIGNSRLALFTSAAFSGSLLEIISEPGGGFHLHGASQKGRARRRSSPHRWLARAHATAPSISGVPQATD